MELKLPVTKIIIKKKGNKIPSTIDDFLRLTQIWHYYGYNNLGILSQDIRLLHIIE